MTNKNQKEGANSFNGLWKDHECFMWEMRNGIHLENRHFVDMYKLCASEICEITNPKDFTDLGGGVGAYSKAMRERSVYTNYYDANIHHHEYASQYKVADRYYYADFTTQQIEGDLIACIEVMEHIEDERLEPFLKRLKCNYFHFSSTPHTSEMDADWGHINIKQENEWVALFESCGFKLDRKLHFPTTWSLLFTK
jgi:2-polyprenyl-3-methyl-5-hydroxy-6-metoxy-1,4-benzoquinol methylase